MHEALIIQQAAPITSGSQELLLLFHGVGSNAQDLQPLGEFLAQQRPQQSRRDPGKRSSRHLPHLRPDRPSTRAFERWRSARDPCGRTQRPAAHPGTEPLSPPTSCGPVPLAADEIADRRPTAAVRHVHDVDTGHRGEQLAREVDRRAIACRRVGQLARTCLRERDQFGDRLGNDLVRVDDENVGHHGDLAHRREILQRVVAQLLVQMSVGRHADPRDDHRVAVGRRLGNGIDTEFASRAGLVFDDHRWRTRPRRATDYPFAGVLQLLGVGLFARLDLPRGVGGLRVRQFDLHMNEIQHAHTPVRSRSPGRPCGPSPHRRAAAPRERLGLGPPDPAAAISTAALANRLPFTHWPMRRDNARSGRGSSPTRCGAR